jgi:hypothetical protein
MSDLPIALNSACRRAAEETNVTPHTKHIRPAAANGNDEAVVESRYARLHRYPRHKRAQYDNKMPW